MARPSLKGVDLKLHRAHAHLEALSKATAKFLRNPDSYELAAEFDDRGRPGLRVKRAKTPPPDWGVLIGETVYNYHSALDHLAFQLAVANTKGRLSRRVAERSAFPIFNSGPKFGRTDRKGVPTANSGLGKLVGVSATAVAIIERLQPYHRWKNPRSRALWQLYELSNVDKHRLLHLTYSSLEGSQFKLATTDPVVLRGYEFFPGPLKANAPIVSWDVKRPLGGGPEVGCGS